MTQDFFSDIVHSLSEDRSQVQKVAIDTLFSKDRDKLLKITDLTNDDLVWSTAFMAMMRYVADDFITDRKLKRNVYKFMEDVYSMRISLDRKGRVEIFEALKASELGMMQEMGVTPRGARPQVQGKL